MPDRDSVSVLRAERVLGEVEARTGQPLRSRHRARAEDAHVRHRGNDVEPLPDRGPEALEVGRRPLPEGLVVGEVEPSRLLQPAGVAGDRRALDAVISHVQRHPTLYPIVFDHARRAVFRRFLYSVIYVVRDNELLIAACIHSRRDPRRWQERI